MILREKLPKSYDLILIDGPQWFIGRIGFLYNLELFDLDSIMVFDDINRKSEKLLMTSVSALLSKPATINETVKGKSFGVIK